MTAYFTLHLQCLCIELNHAFILILIYPCIRHHTDSAVFQSQYIVADFTFQVFVTGFGVFFHCFHHSSSFAPTHFCKMVPMVTLLNIFLCALDCPLSSLPSEEKVVSRHPVHTAFIIRLNQLFLVYVCFTEHFQYIFYLQRVLIKQQYARIFNSCSVSVALPIFLHLCRPCVPNCSLPAMPDTSNAKGTLQKVAMLLTFKVLSRLYYNLSKWLHVCECCTHAYLCYFRDHSKKIQGSAT